MGAFTGRLGVVPAELANIIVGADVTNFGGTNDTDALVMGDAASASLVRIQLPLTPIMTADNAPIGVASSSTLFGAGSAPAYRAFDGGNDDNHMSVLAAAYPVWWQYQFAQPQKVECFALWSRSDNYPAEMPRNFRLLGSDDGINWITLATITNASNWLANQKRVFGVGLPDWYTYYRLSVTSNNGDPSQVSLGELFLYGPPNLVPIMSGNTTPSGVGVASSSDASSTAYMAFDNAYDNTSITTIAAVPTSGAPVWWQYQFNGPTEVVSLALWAPLDPTHVNEMPQAFSLQGSIDGSTWATLTNAISAETGWNAGERRAYPLAITGSYTYYRLLATANNGGSVTSIGELYLMAERIPAELASSKDALTLGHRATLLVSRGVNAVDAVVLNDAPYYGRPFNGTVTDSLAFAEPNTAGHSFAVGVSDTLSVTDRGVWHRSVEEANTGALQVFDSAVASVAKRIADPLTVADHATVRKVTHAKSVDTVTMTSQAGGHDAAQRAAVTDAIKPKDAAIARNAAQRITVTDALAVSDSSSVHNTKIRLSVQDSISTLADSGVLAYHSPKWVSATNALKLSDIAGEAGPVYVSAIDPLTQLTSSTTDPDTLEEIDVYTGLQDSAVANTRHPSQVQVDRLPLGQIAHCGVVRPDNAAGVHTAGATDALALGDASQIVLPTGERDHLVLGDMALVTVGKPTTDKLSIGDKASVRVIRALHATDNIVVEQSFVYVLPYTLVKRDYHPFVGSGTAGDPAPPPTTLTGPNPSAPGEFTLFYPATGTATDTLVLRAPEFGNKDRLQFNRISRETRGGTLIVYADPMWPKTQTLVLTFSALKPAQAEALMEFMENHLGLEIGLWDWEGRQWTGIITNPNDPVVQDSKYSYTGSLEFEGQLV
jgi:hypothetical protein